MRFEEAMKELEKLGIFQMLNTVTPPEGHEWVRSADPTSLPIWCEWCGRNRIDVEDWSDNPSCDALDAARKLLPKVIQ